MAKPTIIFEGFLGKDPEVLSEDKGLKLSVAVSTGKDATDWYNCILWNDSEKQTKFVKEYIKKGSFVIITGLQTQKKIEESKGVYVNVEVLRVQFGAGGGKKKDDATTDPVATDQPAMDMAAEVRF